MKYFDNSNKQHLYSLPHDYAQLQLLLQVKHIFTFYNTLVEIPNSKKLGIFNDILILNKTYFILDKKDLL